MAKEVTHLTPPDQTAVLDPYCGATDGDTTPLPELCDCPACLRLARAAGTEAKD